jgi:twitching motility protein PilI
MTPTQALTIGFDFDAPLDPETSRATAADDGEQRRQGFRIGALALMTRREDAREVTEMPSVYRLPSTPDWFCGMANLNGVPTPVFDLARYLGFERNLQAKPMLLVLAHGADAAGVVIDGLPERLRWSSADRADAAMVPARLASFQHGACLIDEQLWFDLACATLLDALEDALRPAP